MNTIVSIKINPMCDLVLSTVVLKYKDGTGFSLLEEYGTIETLCAKYQIIKAEHDFYDSGHLNGKRCMIEVDEDGKKTFNGYC